MATQNVTDEELSIRIANAVAEVFALSCIDTSIVKDSVKVKVTFPEFNTITPGKIHIDINAQFFPWRLK